VIFLDLDDLLHIAARVVPRVEVRDVGLLEAAVARPQTSAFGQDAYPTLHDKAAALLHSVARNHALVDGNKRLALAAVIAFYGLNGFHLTLGNDDAYELVVAVAAGQLDATQDIALALQDGVAANGSSVDQDG
jgi:death-on-curing protein